MRRSATRRRRWFRPRISRPEQIAQDLAQLAKISDCVRTYSIENGLDQVPALAAKVGLKVIQGIWLSSNRIKNLAQISTAVGLTKEYPGTITALVVGNEVLLRGEMTTADLAANIRSVKAQVTVPVTYADVWEFWLRNREVYDAVDFVTIHILPYWEDMPIRAKFAAAPCRFHPQADGGGISGQGNPDRRDRLAERGADARGRAAVAHQPGPRGVRNSRSRQARRLSRQSDRGL